MARRPLDFAAKIGNQLRVFYSTTCPAFGVRRKFRLTPWSYDASLSVLSNPRASSLLAVVPGGSDFEEGQKRFAPVTPSFAKRDQSRCGTSFVPEVIWPFCW